MDEEIFHFNPSKRWTNQDWEIVESESNNNHWTVSSYGGFKFISIEGGYPIPWPKSGIKIRFEDRIPVEFEYIEPEF